MSTVIKNHTIEKAQSLSIPRHDCPTDSAHSKSNNNPTPSSVDRHYTQSEMDLYVSQAVENIRKEVEESALKSANTTIEKSILAKKKELESTYQLLEDELKASFDEMKSEANTVTTEKISITEKIKEENKALNRKTLREIEENSVKLAAICLNKLIGDSEVYKSAINKCISDTINEIVSEKPYRVYLSEDDRNIFSEQEIKQLTSQQVEFHPKVKKGFCTLETGLTTITTSINDRLQSIQTTLIDTLKH